jgi:hypothetical protein
MELLTVIQDHNLVAKTTELEEIVDKYLGEEIILNLMGVVGPQVYYHIELFLKLGLEHEFIDHCHYQVKGFKNLRFFVSK